MFSGDSRVCSSTHRSDLDGLAIHGADYIAKSFPDDPSADPRVPARIITQLAQIDPDGLTLRYARTSAGAPTLSNPIWVELQPFHTAMRNLSAYVEGAIDGTSWLAENLPY